MNVPVFSVSDGRILGRRAFKEAAKAGADFAERTRAGTRDAMKLRHSPVGSTIRAARQTGQRNSLVQRHLKSADLARHLANALEEVSGGERLSHREFADLLNRRGVLTQQGKPWTASNVRRPREAAKRLLEEEAALAAEDFPSDIMTAEQPATSSPVELPVDPEEEALRSHPMFGVF